MFRHQSNSTYACLEWLAVSTLISAVVVLCAAGGYIGLFNDLTFDDLPRALNNSAPFLEKVINWYLHHNGRFFNALLVSHSGVYELNIYRLLHLPILILWLTSLYLFVHEYLRFFSSEEGQPLLHNKLILFSVIALVTIANSPNLAEWWFWFASATVYMVGSAFLVLGLALWIRAYRLNSLPAWILSGLSFFFAAGSHETLAVEASVLTSFLVLGALKQKKAKSMIASSLAWLGTAAVLLSPGAASRLDVVSGNGVIIQILDTWKHLQELYLPTLVSGLQYWTQDNAWILSALICLAAGLIYSPSSQRHRTNEFIATVIPAASAVFALPVLPIFLQLKVNINDPTRLTSLAYFIFIIAISFSAHAAGRTLAQSRPPFFLNEKISRVIMLLASVGLLAVLIQTTNIQRLYADIVLKRGARQAADIQSWDAIIANTPEHQTRIEVPAFIPAHTLSVGRYGPKADPNYVMNRHWARYKQLKPHQKLVVQHFDQRIIDHIHTQLPKRWEYYNLSHYQDAYRSYLVVRLPTKPPRDRFCTILKSSQNFNTTTLDEAFLHLPFTWEQNRHCTDFISRKVYCQTFSQDWVCRIPLPRKFSGTIVTKWGKFSQSIPTNVAADSTNKAREK